MRPNNFVAKHMHKTSIPKVERLRNKDLPPMKKVMEEADVALDDIHQSYSYLEQMDLWDVYGE